jgi:hypothetical protein
MKATGNRLHFGHDIKIAFGQIDIPVLARTEKSIPEQVVAYITDPSHRHLTPTSDVMPHLFVQTCLISFIGGDSISIDFDRTEVTKLETSQQEYTLHYRVKFRDCNVGTFSANVVDFNQYALNAPIEGENFDSSKENQPVGDLYHLQECLIALAGGGLVGGTFVLSDLSEFEQKGYGAVRALKMLAKRFAHITGNHRIDHQGVNNRTLFGNEVTITKIRSTADGVNMKVVWGTPKFLPNASGVNQFLIGRHTYEQSLSSFLELYPRHLALPYTQVMIQRDTVIIPSMKAAVQLALKTENAKPDMFSQV